MQLTVKSRLNLCTRFNQEKQALKYDKHLYFLQKLRMKSQPYPLVTDL